MENKQQTKTQPYSQVGEIIDINESGYRLIIVGRVWAVLRLSSSVIVAQDSCDDHRCAVQAGLMAVRVYVPDFYVAEEQFRAWLKARQQEVVNAYLDTLKFDIGKFKLEDLLEFGRRRHADLGKPGLNG